MNGQYNGVWTALVTPFTSDKSIDWDSFDKLIERQIQAKITGIILSGTTGESPTLTIQESLSLVRRAKAKFSGQIKIMAGIGGNNTAQTTEMAKLAEDSGADCLLAVTPPYNKPSLQGLKEHYTLITSVLTKPVCLYHVPGRTGQKLTSTELAQLSQIDGLDFIKEASGDLPLFSKVHKDSQFKTIFSGDDPTFLAGLSLGSKGVISVVSNVFPDSFNRLYQAFVRKDNQTALAIHEAMIDFIDILFCEPNPCPTKAILHHLGLCKNSFRLPLVPVNHDNYQKIINAYQSCKNQLEAIQS